MTEKKPRKRKTGARRQAFAERLRAEYYAGNSIRSLVRKTGYSYGTVHNLLVQADTKFRPRGGRRARPVPEDQR